MRKPACRVPREGQGIGAAVDLPAVRRPWSSGGHGRIGLGFPFALHWSTIGSWPRMEKYWGESGKGHRGLALWGFSK